MKKYKTMATTNFDVNSITQYDFPDNQYMRVEFKKVQIYLHHTAGNHNPIATFNDWASNPERIGACVAIGGLPNATNEWSDGEIVQGFSSKFWAYHLGLKEQTFDKFNVPYQSLDKISIAVEICNWGQLTLGADGKFRNYVNGIVPIDQVCTLNKPHRGFKYYHDYTDAQIESVKNLLCLWSDKYGIPLDYNDDIFDVTPRALKGEPGVYTHCSVRFDKTDCYPNTKLINMLKSL